MQAIILKKNIFSEGNEIITLYTRELGKVRVVARGVKSNKSKLAFGLESLFHTEVEILPAKKMPQIIGVKPISSFMNLREDLNKVYAAFYAAELVLKSTADEEPNENLFELLVSFLEHLDISSSVHFCTELFALKALEYLGYGLDLKACVNCRNPLQEETFFSNRKGGFLCSACGRVGTDAKPVDPKVMDLLEKNYDSSFVQFDEKAGQLGVLQKRLHELTDSFAEHILERNLNAGRYIV